MLLSAGHPSVMGNLSSCALRRPYQCCKRNFCFSISAWSKSGTCARTTLLIVRIRCLPGLFATLGPVLANLVSYWRMYLLKCKENLRSTDGAISYLFSPLSIRLTSSAGYFDCHYQIFKLKREGTPLLYHCTSDKNVDRLHQCIFRKGD